MKIAIIGGGIGGLTTAIALQKKGIQVTVYEKAQTLERIGAGLNLAINAMRVLDQLDLAAAIKEGGHVLNGMLITHPDLKPLSKNVLPYFINKYGHPNVAIHRGVLQQLLVEALLPDTLKTGHECIDLIDEKDQVQLVFKDGKKAYADMAIGADGIHSLARQKISQSSAMRYSGQTCWRGVVKMPDSGQDWSCLSEAWGKGRRFGFTRINANEVYWYASINCGAGGKDDKSKLTTLLVETFKDFSERILEIIKATPAEEILRQDIYDFKPLSVWNKGRIGILGDAAHATTPNLGQGACQAIEDALCIAELVSEGIKHSESSDTIFKKFYKARFERVRFISEMSAGVGKLSQLENPLLIKLRNTMMEVVPDFINRQRFEKIFGV